MTVPPGPTDPHRRLTLAEVRDLAGPGFAQIGNRLEARYRTGDFATGLHLAGLIGELAERWDHHPDLILTYSNLVVSLVSHDDSAITPRDIRMSHLVGQAAADMGLQADVADLTRVEWCLDTRVGEQLAPFYAALLGSSVRDGEFLDPSGQTPAIRWQEGDDTDTAALRQSSQRWHADVWVAQGAAGDRVAAVLSAGGKLVSDAHAPSFWIVADPDGNRHCIRTHAGR